MLARVEQWRRRAPKLTDDTISTAHGAGGRASQALYEALIKPKFGNEHLDRLDDAVALSVPPGHRVVVSTDAFVVTPRRFSGGSIGHLAVNGTVNDLACLGAAPAWLTLAVVAEEGLAVDELSGILDDVAAACEAAGVQVVGGDTKVVERGAADGCYLTTTGIGFVRDDVRLCAEAVTPGDAVLLSGPMGDHGIAVMLARGELALAADVTSDTAPLHRLVAALLDAVPSTRWLRDPTRGGVASALNELTHACGLGVTLAEQQLPVRDEVAGACELLGLDPLYVANEGRMIAVVPQAEVDPALDALRSLPEGANAARIGEISEDPAGLVVLRTAMGGSRVVDMLVGDPLPRIC